MTSFWVRVDRMFLSPWLSPGVYGLEHQLWDTIAKLPAHESRYRLRLPTWRSPGQGGQGQPTSRTTAQAFRYSNRPSASKTARECSALDKAHYHPPTTQSEWECLVQHRTLSPHQQREPQMGVDAHYHPSRTRPLNGSASGIARYHPPARNTEGVPLPLPLPRPASHACHPSANQLEGVQCRLRHACAVPLSWDFT